MILVDFSGLIIAGAMTQKNPVVDEGLLRHNCLNTILSVKKKFGAKYGDIVLCYDGNNYWRRGIYPHYKGNRKASKEESTFDWKLFYTFMDKIKEELRTVFPYKIIELDNCEADDIIGTLALEAKEETIIYSRDQDFIQCLANPRVKLWSADKKKLYEKMLPYEVEWHIFQKVCQGDKGDWVPNIFSDINALQDRVRQTNCKESVVEILYKDPSAKEWTVTIKERYELNEKLINLKCIDPEIKQKIRDAFELPVIGSKGRIFAYLMNKQLNALGGHFVKDINSF